MLLNPDPPFSRLALRKPRSPPVPCVFASAVLEARTAEEVAVQDAVNATVGGLLLLEDPLIYSIREGERSAGQGPLDKLNASDRAPTKTRLNAQVASRLNQLRDTNLRPK